MLEVLQRIKKPLFTTKRRGRKLLQRKVGVTHPGQIRYIYYMQDILKNGPTMYMPKMKRLLGIRFHGIPNFNAGSCRPQIDIYNVRDNVKVL